MHPNTASWRQKNQKFSGKKCSPWVSPLLVDTLLAIRDSIIRNAARFSYRRDLCRPSPSRRAIILLHTVHWLPRIAGPMLCSSYLLWIAYSKRSIRGGDSMRLMCLKLNYAFSIYSMHIANKIGLTLQLWRCASDIADCRQTADGHLKQITSNLTIM